MCTTCPGNEQTIEDADEFKQTDEFEEMVDGSIIFNTCLWVGAFA